jgi:hypothetical protein
MMVAAMEHPESTVAIRPDVDGASQGSGGRKDSATPATDVA